MATTPDLEAIKSGQQNAWASGDYAAVAAKIHPIAEDLVRAAGLEGGARVLDVATGSGNAAMAAARYDCQVTALDYVPSLLERGRARAAAESLKVDFVEGDAEALPFQDETFDAVISVVGVMFAPNQQKAAAELLRVCRPGGKIALANWTPDGFAAELFALVARHAPPPPNLNPPTNWGTPAKSEELLGELTEPIDFTRQEFIIRATSAADYATFMTTNFGPIKKAQKSTPDNGHQLHTDLTTLCKHHNTAPKTLAIPATYLQILATKL